MAEEKKQTALQRWGSKESTPAGKFFLLLGVVVVVCLLWGGWIFVGSTITDDREEREEVLDSRYVEEIELDELNTAGTPEVVTIDGTVREDCTATDDDYLECEDDPQPTLEPSAE